MFKHLSQSSAPNGRFTFEAHNIDLSIMNGIRRTILSDIPVVGFKGEEDSEGSPPSLAIVKNNGPLHNEFMLHRIGLIPIHFSEDETDGFVSDDYKFELAVTNESQNTMNVTTESFKVHHHDKEINPAKLFPKNAHTKEYVLITRLRPGEELEVKGKAIKTTARHHASFSPVSLCTFSFMTNGNPDPSLGVLDRERDFIKNEYGDPIAIMFALESECALSPNYLVKKAFDIILEKLRVFLNSLSAPGIENNDDEPALSLGDVQVSVKRSDVGVDFQIPEDDTIGNILQSLMHNHYIREKNVTSKNHVVTFVGYYPPHPLEKSVVVRICCDNHTNVDTNAYIDIMKDSTASIVQQIEALKRSWIDAVDNMKKTDNKGKAKA